MGREKKAKKSYGASKIAKRKIGKEDGAEVPRRSSWRAAVVQSRGSKANQMEAVFQ